MIRESKHIVLLLILLLLGALQSNAQLKEGLIIRDTLYSNVLKEKRALEIVLPQDYAQNAATRYDATYVTDGEWNTQIVTNISRFLEIQFIPANIIVSMPNTYKEGKNMRDRDLTPTRNKMLEISGGADKYFAFIKTELMPYINKKYRSTGQNTLFGGSFGGVYAMYSLLKDPHLFQSYLIADPAFHWDNRYMLKQAGEKLGQLDLNGITLLMTGREGQPAIGMGIKEMDSVFRVKAPGGLRWKTLYYDDETHNSMIFRTLYDGFKYTYFGYSKEHMDFHPQNGIMQQGLPLKLNFFSDLLRDIHYTTDGSQPNASSTALKDNSLILQQPERLIIKALNNRHFEEQADTANFISGTVLPGKARSKGLSPQGWAYAYYEGSWAKMPDFATLKPLQTGKAGKDFSLEKLPRQQNFAFVLQGQVLAETTGYYIFGLDVNGTASLFIDDQLLISGTDMKGLGRFKSYVIPLAKGFHKFRLTYLHQLEKPSLEVVWDTPDHKNDGQIPLSLQYGKSK